MRVIEIPEDALTDSVRAQADDIVVFRGVGYRVIVSPKGFLCRYCDCFSKNGCKCLPFDCTNQNEYPHGTHLVRVCPEEGGEK